MLTDKEKISFAIDVLKSHIDSSFIADWSTEQIIKSTICMVNTVCEEYEIIIKGVPYVEVNKEVCKNDNRKE